MPPRNLIAIFLTALVSLICHQKAERNRHAATIAQAIRLTHQFYVEQVDDRRLFENAMAGLTNGLDQYSEFIGPDSFRQVKASLDQEFGGVGIEVEKPELDGPILILSPIHGSPAYRAGLISGDEILAVEGRPTATMQMHDALGAMRGKPGAPVRLRIRRAGQANPFEVTITREIIAIESVLGDERRGDGTWDFHLRANARIALFRVNTFGENTAVELRQALSENQSCAALLIDLRNNAGGLLNVAVDVCDLFLSAGRIVSTQGRHGVVRESFDATPELVVPRDKPLVILVNQYSASAAEIVAACLQDHGRAVIVGQRTWGKGTVQNLFPLEGGRSAIKITTATYWRPSQRNIHRFASATEDEHWGVRPDAGFDVRVADEELERIVRARRDRDVHRDELSRQPGKAPEAAAEPYPDPQLQKAIEYLEQQIRADNAQSPTA